MSATVAAGCTADGGDSNDVSSCSTLAVSVYAGGGGDYASMKGHTTIMSAGNDDAFTSVAGCTAVVAANHGGDLLSLFLSFKRESMYGLFHLPFSAGDCTFDGNNNGGEI